MPATVYDLERTDFDFTLDFQVDNELSSQATLSHEDYRDAYRFGKGFNRLQNTCKEKPLLIMQEAWKDMIGPGNLQWEQVKDAVLDGYLDNSPV